MAQLDQRWHAARLRASTEKMQTDTAVTNPTVIRSSTLSRRPSLGLRLTCPSVRLGA